jgi:hypothetical protein
VTRADVFGWINQRFTPHIDHFLWLAIVTGNSVSGLYDHRELRCPIDLDSVPRQAPRTAQRKTACFASEDELRQRFLSVVDQRKQTSILAISKGQQR